MNRAPAVLVAVGAAGVFVAASGRVIDPMLAVGASAIVVAALVAERNVVVAATAAVVAICVAPIYWGRGIGGFGVAAIPATGAALVLVLASTGSVHRVRLVALDCAVGAYLICRAAAYLVNFDSGPGAAVGYASRIAIVYVAFRVVSLLPSAIGKLAAGLGGSAVLLAILARLERSSGENPFFTLLPSGYQASAWARPELRFGALRVETSFGHPIAFGLFLALALVVIVAVAWRTTSMRRRLACVGGAVAVSLALLDTLSRGPLLVAVLAVVAWAMFERRTMSGGRLLGMLAVVACVLAFTPALFIVEALWASSRGDTREARSAEYRLTVANVLTDRDQFSLLGRPTSGSGDVTTQASARVGLKSIDNEFALVYVTGGLLSLVAFVVVVVLQWRILFLRGLAPIERAWMAGLAATSLGLTTVALLTQHGDLFWASMAIAASLRQCVSTPAVGTLSPDRVAVAA